MNRRDAERFGPVVVALRDGQTVVVRPVARGDGEAMAEFYAAVPAKDCFFYCPYPLTRENALARAAEAECPWFVCLVAQAGDGRLAGYAWYRWKEAAAAMSHFGMCIRPEFQGVGVGRGLMRRLLEVAGEVGPPRMCLTVQKSNPRAVSLYGKMGFTVVREQVRARDGEPEYYMERACR